MMSCAVRIASSQTTNAHQHAKHIRHQHIRHQYVLAWVFGFISVLSAHAQSPTASINTPVLDAAMWTLHVATYGSAQRARAHADRLNQQGFDAYVQPYSTQLESNQLVGWQRWQVRVGCFLNEIAAGYTSAPLQTLTGGSSTLVPLVVGADVRVCVDHQLGFLVPDQWQLFAETAWAVAFEVILMDQSGYVVYNDVGWRVMQDIPTDDVLRPWLLFEDNTFTSAPGNTSEAHQSRYFSNISVILNLSTTRSTTVGSLSTGSLSRRSRRTLGLAADVSVASSNETMDVVTYQFGQGTHVTDGASDMASVSPARTAQTIEQNMTAAERSLARSLARLPAQPQVSLRSTITSFEQDAVARAQAHQTSSLTQSHVNNRNMNISPQAQSIIIAIGNLLWQSSSAAVVQADGQIVSLVMFPPPYNELAEAPPQHLQPENVHD